MFRKRARRPRKPKVYRIPIETYLVTLAIAFALSVALSMLSKPREVSYRLPHQFAVEDPTFLPSAHGMTNPATVPGNRVRLLENGDEIFPAMLAAIRTATKTVDLEAYIFWSGKVGTEFREALSERASKGVAVKLVLDAVGSKSHLLPADLQALRASGCVVEFFHPLRPWMLDSINNRTHRRILVVDGRMGFTGGVGFADEWLGNADAEKHWRETCVEVQGPVVAQLQASFAETWAQLRGETLLGDGYYPPLEPAGNIRCQVIASTESSSSSATKLLYAVSIASATKSIRLSNSYFLPDAETSAALVDAAKRGVRVEIIVPGKVNDVPATKAGGRSSFGDLLRGGVRIFEFRPTMFHPKTMVVDGLFATVGSTNFDNRSFRLNDEINLTMYDSVLAGRMEELFRKDRARSRPYTYEDYQRRSLRDRLFEWAVLPFRSEL